VIKTIAYNQIIVGITVMIVTFELFNIHFDDFFLFHIPIFCRQRWEIKILVLHSICYQKCPIFHFAANLKRQKGKWIIPVRKKITRVISSYGTFAANFKLLI